MDFGMPYLLEMASIEECCSLAQRLGLQFVELNANFPDCLVETLDPVLLHQLGRKYGLYFTLHVEEEFNPFSFNTVVGGAWLKSMRHAMDIAVALQMPIVNMHFPHGVYISLPDRKTYLHEKYREEFYAALHDFRGMCEETLTGANTRIAIENTDGGRHTNRVQSSICLNRRYLGLRWISATLMAPGM